VSGNRSARRLGTIRTIFKQVNGADVYEEIRGEEK
jgi:hypothetical protein